MDQTTSISNSNNRREMKEIKSTQQKPILDKWLTLAAQTNDDDLVETGERNYCMLDIIF